MPSFHRLFRFLCVNRPVRIVFFIILAMAVVTFSGGAEAKAKHDTHVAHKKAHAAKHHASSKSARKPVARAGYIPPYADIVIDARTGQVLSQTDADRALYPASLTKLMTLLMTFEALDAKTITLKSSVPMSSHATSMPPSKIGLRAGQSISVENAIKALVTKSANDVAVAMGEKLGGTEGRFAQMMNLKARALGMSQTHFVNACGLHNVQQVSSARDMAKLALYILRTYPQYYSYFSLKEFTFNGKTHANHNHLMSSYQGMDGMKTGYVTQSGFNLVASAKHGNTRLIGVIFGGKTANARNAKMAEILDEGFEQVGSATSPAKLSAKPSANPSAKPPAKQGDTVSVITLPAPNKSPTLSASQGVKVPVNGETLAVAAKQQVAPSSLATTEPAAGTPVAASVAASPSVAATPAGWSIQIGAYQDRVSTDQALARATQKLPAPLNKGTALVVPMKTAANTWVFRARLGGYTKEQAQQACRYLDNCLPLSPGAN